jgi:hypothetical protein
MTAIWQHVGMARPRAAFSGGGGSTAHPGSKRGHTHLTDVAADPARRIERAQAWSRQTGRPVPPHLRPREPLPPEIEPLSPGERLVSYQVAFRRSDRTARVTAAQYARLRHKHGRRVAAQVTGFDPAEREQARVRRARAVREISARYASMTTADWRVFMRNALADLGVS